MGAQASLDCQSPLWHFTPDKKYVHVAKGLPGHSPLHENSLISRRMTYRRCEKDFCTLTPVDDDV